ncbi:uncharacterized protein [Arachis hypogaea]|uniref:uncharacterized protein n=1 Tax=Arachis hypogaea TaxID=3818 RepID=UPI000DEC7554|nr:uncharacterized protein LOC112717671 [Arachis hypogaea]
MVETIVVLKTSSVRVGDQIDESTKYFHHIFWIFPLCIEAFRHCKPMVSIDGTQLYAKHNGNNAALEVPDSGWLPPRAYQAFCICHIAANFSLSFKNYDVKRLLLNATYVMTKA